MLGYEMFDVDQMINAIHDSKIHYIASSPAIKIDEDPIVDGLLKSIDFLQGLWAEGYFDGYQD